MIPTLAVLAVVCILSLLFILVIPYFASVKALLGFLPRDVREAAAGHPDPPAGRRMIGWILTAAAAFAYLGAIRWIGADGIRHGEGFWQLFGRYMLFLYGYKLFDILVQDQYIVITRKYFVRFFPESKDCGSWNDRSFNTKNQLVRIAVFPFVSALLAWMMLEIGG